MQEYCRARPFDDGCRRDLYVFSAAHGMPLPRIGLDLFAFLLAPLKPYLPAATHENATLLLDWYLNFCIVVLLGYMAAVEVIRIMAFHAHLENFFFNLHQQPKRKERKRAAS